MIPRRFFGFFDLITLTIAFFASYWLVPVIEQPMVVHNMMQLPLIAALSPPAGLAGQLQPLSSLLWVLLVFALSTVLFLDACSKGGQWIHCSRYRIVLAGFAAPFTGLAIISLALFAVKRAAWSRLFLFLFVLISGFGLIVYRLILRAYFYRRQQSGYYAKNVVLIGLPSSIRWMTRYFKENVPSTSYRLLGQLGVPNGPDPVASPLCNGAQGNVDEDSIDIPPVLGNASELGNLLISRPIHEVIAIQSTTDGNWIKKVIEDCDNLGVLLRIVPEALVLAETSRLQTLYHMQTLHLPAVVLTPPHWDSDALFIKRLLDIVISSLLLLFLMPLFLIVAVAIKLTTPKLPVFYRWRVVGRNGVEFTGYKFTTMVSDADDIKPLLMKNNEMSGPVFKIKDDPRTTRLGRFLRKYSVNELPQLWSVLKGDMSLVGPRPAFRYELERYEFWQKRKLSISPGITCLWQVRGRNSISDFNDWVKMDLEYIDTWSIWLDFKILVRTAWAVIAGTGS